LEFLLRRSLSLGEGKGRGGDPVAGGGTKKNSKFDLIKPCQKGSKGKEETVTGKRDAWVEEPDSSRTSGGRKDQGKERANGVED